MILCLCFLTQFKVLAYSKTILIPKYIGGRPCDEEANVLNCDIIGNEFEPQSHYYVSLRTNT